MENIKLNFSPRVNFPEIRTNSFYDDDLSDEQIKASGSFQSPLYSYGRWGKDLVEEKEQNSNCD